MTVALIEGFELFSQTNGANLTTEFTEKHPASANVSSDNLQIVAGRLAGKAVQMRGLSTTLNFDFAQVTNQEVVFGFAVMRPTSQSQGNITNFVRLSDDNGTLTHIGLAFDASEQLVLCRLSPGANIAATFGTLTQGQWYYIEVHCKVHNSTGFLSLYVDGVQVGTTVSGVDTDATVVASGITRKLVFSRAVNGSTLADGLYIDDVYILTAASGLTPLGPSHIVGLMPTAEGSTINYTPSTGADNSALVDELPRDITDYNSDTPVSGNKDLFDMSALSDSGTPVALQHNICCATTTGTVSVDGTLLSSGNAQTIAARNITAFTVTTTVRTLKAISEVDPNTSAPWTQSGINAAEFGYTSH